jgi:hypothetical protein
MTASGSLAPIQSHGEEIVWGIKTVFANVDVNCGIVWEWPVWNKKGFNSLLQRALVEKKHEVQVHYKSCHAIRQCCNLPDASASQL